ncbi:hypothetical protein O3M35_006662 [Rhynocoris fuscipes]|uniref:Uncharacterized protein n=1 Tax=Rhynocoris fuscipes TaxID=488301 RepID=A0AAW1DLI9_9HEMI
MYLDEKKSFGKWWICAGLFGIAITAAFIASILYLSSDNPRSNIRPRFRHVQELEDIETIYENEETTIIPPPKLSSGPDPITLDELQPIKKTPIRKKSEAVYPTDWSEELTRPIVIDPQQELDDNFQLPGLTRNNNPKRQAPSSGYVNDNDYNEDSENPLYTLLQTRLKDVYDIVDSRKSMNTDWIELIDSVNQSLAKNNASIVMNKLKDMYYNSSSPDVAMSSLIYPTRQGLMKNVSNILSFGLLAVDLFLLHNVQQIAISEERSISEQMRKDPEVQALNALFLSPEKINELGRSRQDTEMDTSKGVFEELLDFTQGVIRGVVNLGKAYKKTAVESQARSNRPSPLDCIWTLYCRNLDKTAKLNGPYGLLAKLNR